MAWAEGAPPGAGLGAACEPRAVVPTQPSVPRRGGTHQTKVCAPTLGEETERSCQEDLQAECVFVH